MRAYHAHSYDSYFVGVEGDVDFYVSQARKVSGHVLEVGSGTGRILVPLAKAGVHVIGLEPDEELAQRSRQRLAGLDETIRSRVQLIRGMVQEMELGQTLAAALLPYRMFQHLLTPVDQAEALGRLYDHLEPGGLLVMDTYDPLQEMIAEGLNVPLRRDTDFIDPVSGRLVVVWYARQVDPELQLLQQDFVFEEVDSEGRSQQRTVAQLVLRYTPWREMEYLLELCGFSVEELYGDFLGGAYPGFGNQIWVARKT